MGEILDRRINDLYGAEVSDDDKLHFAHDIVDRIERNEALMAQVRSHNETKVMHELFPRMVSDGLRNKEKLSVSLLRDEKKGRTFALLIVKLLAGCPVVTCVPSSKLRKGHLMADNDP